MSDAGFTEHNKIAKGSLVVYLERVVVLALSFLTSVLLARFLTENDFGLYRLVISLLTICTYIVGLGIEAIIQRYVPEFLARSEDRLAGLSILLVASFRTLAVLLMLVGFFAFRSELGNAFNAETLFDQYFLPVAGILTFRLIGSALGKAVLTAYGDRYLAGYVTMAGHTVLTSSLAAAVLFGNGLRPLMLALSVTAGFESLLFLAVVLPRLVRAIRLPGTKGDGEALAVAGLPLKRMISFGIYNFLWLGGQVFREYSVDSYVIAAFADPSAVALYGIAAVIPQLMRSFSPGRMLSGVLMPSFVSRYTREEGREGTRRHFILLQKVNVSVYVPMMVFFAVLADRLLPLVYGEGYSRSVNTALILIVLSLAQSVADPYYLISQVIEKPQYVFYSSVWGVVNLGLAVLLVPRFGIEGAAVATGTSSVLVLAYFLVIYRMKVGAGYGLPWRSFFKTAINSLPIMLSAFIARGMRLFHPLAIGSLLVGGLGYLLLTKVNAILTQEERRIIDELAPVAIPFL